MVLWKLAHLQDNSVLLIRIFWAQRRIQGKHQKITIHGKVPRINPFPKKPTKGLLKKVKLISAKKLPSIAEVRKVPKVSLQRYHKSGSFLLLHFRIIDQVSNWTSSIEIVESQRLRPSKGWKIVHQYIASWHCMQILLSTSNITLGCKADLCLVINANKSGNTINPPSRQTAVDHSAIQLQIVTMLDFLSK